MFEHELSLWDERVRPADLIVRPEEVWILYLFTAPLAELDVTTLEGIKVSYRSDKGLRRFQSFNMGFGKARPGIPCFPDTEVQVGE